MQVKDRATDAERVLAQGFRLALCCVVALAVHAILAADALDDAQALATGAGGLLVLAVAGAMSLFATRKARGRTARVALVVLSTGTISLAGFFAWTNYPDASVELASLIAPAEAAGQAVIALGPTGRDVRLSGDISEGAAAQLAAILEAHPAVERIHLTSEGGEADEGQALARVIAAHRLATYVPDFCVSACTLAFVAGRERLVMDGARLGFHAPYLEGLLGQSFAGDSKDQRAAYLAAGIAPAFVSRALGVAPDDMWFPTNPQLIAAHVVTGVVDRYRLPDSILDGVATVSGARAKVMENFPTLDHASAKSVDTIAAWYLDAYRHGMSEGDAVDKLNLKVRAALVEARPPVPRVATLMPSAR